jgi:hypothetical protein
MSKPREIRASIKSPKRQSNSWRQSIARQSTIPTPIGII